MKVMSRNPHKSGFTSVEITHEGKIWKVIITDDMGDAGVEEFTREEWAFDSFEWWAEYIR